MNDLEFEDLRTEFKAKARVLKAKVFDECPLKVMNGKPLTGLILSELLKMYVESINDGGVPKINDAWTGVVEQQREKCFENSK